MDEAACRLQQLQDKLGARHPVKKEKEAIGTRGQVEPKCVLRQEECVVYMSRTATIQKKMHFE